MRRLAATLTLALLGATLCGALARTVEIISADRLELRKVDGQELVIISGEKVELKLDKDTVQATRVEYNKTRRTLTLVGAGLYRSFPTGPNGQETEQVLTGENLVVDLGTENLTGEDVIVTTTDLEIRGEDVERVPGQLRVSSGYFTPCAKCGRTPNDYAFRANRVLLYPGDRLVAYGATLLLADAPVAYLPVVVLLLQDKDRQPRFQIAQDATDGLTALLDLPFVVGPFENGASAQGFSLLRYYQNRSAKVGFGVNLRAYNLPLGARLVDLYALANPRPVGQEGYNIDFRLNARGVIDLPSARNGIEYTLDARRDDTGAGTNTAARGVTDVTFSAKAAFEAATVTLNYDDRFGPEPTGPLPRALKRPEFGIDFNPVRFGDFSADLDLLLGNYRAPSNPLNRRARTEGPNVTRFRLQESHTITYLTRPWTGAEFGIRNTFTGRYYSSGERVVDLLARAELTQNFSPATSATLSYEYRRQEGTSPFSGTFDQSFSRRLSALLSLSGRSRLTDWLTVEGSQSYDFVLPADQQAPATFGVTLTPRPLQARGTLRYDFFRNRLEDWNVSSTLGDSTGFTLNVGTSFNRVTGYSPLVTTLSYRDPSGSSTVSVGATYDLQKGYLDSVTGALSATATRDAIVNPVTLNINETFNVRNPRLRGSETVTWRGVSFGIENNFLFPDGVVEPSEDYPGKCAPFTADSRENCGTLNLSVGSQGGASTTWGVRYGGTYDLGRGGWVAPTLTGSLRVTQPNQFLEARAEFATPGLDSPLFELTTASLGGRFDVTPRVGLSGNVLYSRSRSGSTLNERLTLRPLALTFALGRAERPDAYLTTTFDQEFLWVNGQAPQAQPLRPIVLLTIDRCCWSVQFEVNPVRGFARLSLALPTGNGQSVVVDPNGPRFPGLPFGGTP